MVPKRLQTIMGHSWIRLTYDVYRYLFPSEYEDHAAMAEIQWRPLGARLRHGARKCLRNNGRHQTANPCTPVRFRARPPRLLRPDEGSAPTLDGGVPIPWDALLPKQAGMAPPRSLDGAIHAPCRWLM